MEQIAFFLPTVIVKYFHTFDTLQVLITSLCELLEPASDAI